MDAMPLRAKSTILAMFWGLGLCYLWAQDGPRQPGASKAVLQRASANANDERDNDRALTQSSLNQDDRLSLIAAALDARVRRNSEHDCSHLVHAIYERAGFPYAYAPSSDLYAGVEEFQRVKLPEPGDLVVWRGHAGIVIKPSQHIFFSYMRSGPGTDDFQTPYWKSRGHPRFYRYIKNASCAGCDSSQRSRQLVKIKR